MTALQDAKHGRAQSLDIRKTRPFTGPILKRCSSRRPAGKGKLVHCQPPVNTEKKLKRLKYETQRSVQRPGCQANAGGREYLGMVGQCLTARNAVAYAG